MATCNNPYITGTQLPAPCGRCAGCLVNRKTLWVHRIVLESKLHERNSFVTLTYKDDQLPKTEDGFPTLRYPDLKNFLKRLRAKRKGRSLSYYAVGEYGTQGTRGINPHWHLCLFNVGIEDREAVHESWVTSEGKGKKGESLGHTLTGSLNIKSAMYVAGYVQKKTVENKELWNHLGIEPEKAYMSLGLGKGAVPLIAEQIRKHPELLTETGDVPTYLLHGKKKLPLGRYLREKLREELNMSYHIEELICPETGLITERKRWHAKELQKKLYSQELQDLQKNTQEDKKLPENAQASVKHLLAYQNQQQLTNEEKRRKLFTTQKTL
jgi:hypothetical protein